MQPIENMLRDGRPQLATKFPAWLRRVKERATGRTLVAFYDVRLDSWEMVDQATGERVGEPVASSELAAKYELLPELPA